MKKILLLLALATPALAQPAQKPAAPAATAPAPKPPTQADVDALKGEIEKANAQIKGLVDLDNQQAAQIANLQRHLGQETDLASSNGEVANYFKNKYLSTPQGQAEAAHQQAGAAASTKP